MSSRRQFKLHAAVVTLPSYRKSHLVRCSVSVRDEVLLTLVWLCQHSMAPRGFVLMRRNCPVLGMSYDKEDGGGASDGDDEDTCDLV